MTISGDTKNIVYSIPTPNGEFEDKTQEILEEYRKSNERTEDTYNAHPQWEFRTRKTPMIGWKQHDLRVTNLGIKIPSFNGNNLANGGDRWWDDDYDGILEAGCARGYGNTQHDTSPYPNCQCGFWSMATPSDAASASGSGILLLRCKLYGVVEQRDKGYRSQLLDVDIVYGPPHCILCNSEEYNFVMKRSDLFQEPSRYYGGQTPGSSLNPLCDEHGPSDKATSFVKLSQASIGKTLNIDLKSGNKVPVSQRI